jgi:hypothetical protein
LSLRYEPWSEIEVDTLNTYQLSGWMHPYTCGAEVCRAVLVATKGGWVCLDCDYTQMWCHASHAEPLSEGAIWGNSKTTNDIVNAIMQASPVTGRDKTAYKHAMRSAKRGETVVIYCPEKKREWWKAAFHNYSNVTFPVPEDEPPFPEPIMVCIDGHGGWPILLLPKGEVK